MYFQRAGNVPPAVYSFEQIHFTDLILGAAFVVSAVNSKWWTLPSLFQRQVWA
jgi:hypothetical protein